MEPASGLGVPSRMFTEIERCLGTSNFIGVDGQNWKGRKTDG